MRTARIDQTGLKLSIVLLLSLCPNVIAQTTTRVAVLDFGESATSRRLSDRIARALAQSRTGKEEFQLIDRDQARAAAAGSGYKGSLNMTLQEARDLGSAMGCEFFFTGVANTLRRSPSDGPVYFESYATIYIVSSRTGRLVFWERFSARSSAPQDSEHDLLEKVVSADANDRYRLQIYRSRQDELIARAQAIDSPAPVIDEAPDDSTAVANGLQLPRPYRRIKPPYPEEAARAEVEATVDALADIDARGEVGRVEIVRWAGYGLDQSVIDTVRQLHFFPAHRDREPIPMRVLLRYNFRKPLRDDKGLPVIKP